MKSIDGKRHERVNLFWQGRAFSKLSEGMERPCEGRYQASFLLILLLFAAERLRFLRRKLKKVFI